MKYKTARDFLKNVRSKITNGERYYTVTQVAEGLGVDWTRISQAIACQDLEKKLGFKFVRRSYNAGRYFPEDAISKLYGFKDEIFGVEED